MRREILTFVAGSAPSLGSQSQCTSRFLQAQHVAEDFPHQGQFTISISSKNYLDIEASRLARRLIRRNALFFDGAVRCKFCAGR